MKVVPEHINELSQFKRGGENSLKSLGIGKYEIIKKYFQNIHNLNSYYDFEINNDFSVDVYKFNKLHFIISSDYISCFIFDDCKSKLEFNGQILIYFLENEDNYRNELIDKIIKLFPDKFKKIILLIKYVYNNISRKSGDDIKNYILEAYPEIAKLDPYYFYQNIRDKNILKDILHLMTPNQQLELSYYNKYDKGIIDALKRGANPHTEGYAYFDWALSENKTEIVKLMLQHELFVSKINTSYVRFLMNAIKNNYKELVKILIPYFKDIPLGPNQLKVYNQFAKENNLSIRNN